MLSKYVRSFRESASKNDYERDRKLKPLKGIEIDKDIKYGRGGKYNLLDVYYPSKTKKKLPVIINVHGGGYVYGYKEIYFHYCLFLAKQGFSVINFNYHLAPEKKFPTQLEDINKVLWWINENKNNYFFDINNVFMVGDSAGAQLVSHYLAIYSNQEFAKLFSFKIPSMIKIKAAGLNCGLFDLSDAYKKNPLITINHVSKTMKSFDCYLGRKRDEIYPLTQFLCYINSNYPPCSFITSYYDFLKENSKPMSDFLVSKNVETEFDLYGDEKKTYLTHVFHVNMNLKEAKIANLKQINFFKKYIDEE